MIRKLFLVALLCLATAGCDVLGIGGNDDGEFKDNREKWNRRGPDSYSFVMQRSCFCGGELRDAVRIVVEDGNRVSATYVGSGQPVRADFLQFFPTMDGIFEILEEAYADADSLDVRYDAALGYPIEAYIDYLKNARDDELSFTISGVMAR